jgi:hypothetical protein
MIVVIKPPRHLVGGLAVNTPLQSQQGKNARLITLAKRQTNLDKPLY